MKLRFKKSERLCAQKQIDELFLKGETFFVYPLKLYAMPDEQKKLLISVPKRMQKKAVDRNLIKRRIRESYRTQKLDFELDNSFRMALVYCSKQQESQEHIRKAVAGLLTQLSDSNTKKQ
ncbi:MAG: ribonuclease P protein component [Flavobacteriales bacterium]